MSSSWRTRSGLRWAITSPSSSTTSRGQSGGSPITTWATTPRPSRPATRESSCRTPSATGSSSWRWRAKALSSRAAAPIMARREAARIFEEVLAGQASGPPVVLATVVQAPPEAAAAGGGYQVMFELHEPPATLVIVGGGHIGKALATIGDLCGFSVVVVDDRPDYANQERFPEAGRVVCGDFAEVLRGLPIDSNTYVVTVTRGHKHDEESLRQVAESPAAYVGMIGSKRRGAAVLQHLIDDGLDPEAVRRVHTPIGLDIGAETPEEIAVAIMAEVVQVRRGGSGRPMREVKKARRGVTPAA